MALAKTKRLMTNPPARVRPRVRFITPDQVIALGPGKAALLAAIRDQGSISAAAKQLGMSYRRAWMLADSMNQCFRQPLIVTAKGGAHGGGAVLSALGAQVLGDYRAMERAMLNAARAPIDSILAALAPASDKS